MHRDLERGFEKVERQKRDILAGLAGREDAWLNRAPAPGAWSIVQVISHLVLAEAGTFSYIGKKMLAKPEEIPDVTLMSAVRSLALATVLASPLRWKAPERSRPAGDPESLDSVRGRWDGVREDLRERLETFPEALMGKAVFRHPFAGRLGMRQTLKFLDDHQRHHARQIERFKSLLG